MLSALKNFILENPHWIDLQTEDRCAYFWEYKLSNTQYLRLKEILVGLDLQNHKDLLRKKPLDSPLGTVAFYVILYVSEWYKRECTALDGDHCLEPIGLKGESQRVWKDSGLPEVFLHKTDSRRNEMRQIAMCTLGGLPINYVIKSPRFKEFINNLSEIFNGDTITTNDDVEKIVRCFDDGNGVFKSSLESGSCKGYLIELINYLEQEDVSFLPFNKGDLELPLFAEFIKQLREGYDENLPKRFFHSELRLWTSDNYGEYDGNGIESDYYIHIGQKKSENEITTKELRKLGVTLPPETNSFDLRLNITQKDGTSRLSEEKRIYFRIGNNCDDFRGAFGSYISTSIDLFNLKEISLWLECGEYKKEIHKYTMPQHLELYSTNDYYLWTTSTNNSGKKVLFYDKNEYTPINTDDEIITKTDGESNWGWIYQKGTINLKDSKGEIQEFTLGASELIMVNFRVKELRKNIELLSDDCVQSVIEGEQAEPVHLLYYSDNRKNLIITCDGFKDQQLFDNYLIEYKEQPLNEGRYIEWTKENCPSQGFIKLRIRCRDISKKKRIWLGVVYFIPAGSPIVNRNFTNNYIYFKGNNILPLHESFRQSFRPADNGFDYKLYDQYGGDPGQVQPTISFKIGYEDNYIIIDTYRAFKWKQIWNNDILIKDIVDTDTCPPVAVILQKNIQIKIVDEDGYKTFSPNHFLYLDYFADPRSISRVTFSDDAAGAYCLYIYLSCFEDKSGTDIKTRKIEKKDNSILLNVSDKHIDKYVFYYWSGSPDEEPTPLECNKIESKKYEFIIPSPLTGKAVVFQSLKDNTPNIYFRPFYANDNWLWDIYFNRYSLASTNYCIKCFKLAATHNIYFSIFPAIRLLQNRNLFTEFIRTFILSKNYNLSKQDLEDLTRLAKESAMDWFFVNRNKLFAGLNEEKAKKMRECMKKLLLYSPIGHGEKYYSKRFILEFLKNSNRFDVRDGKLPRTFLKVMDDFSRYDEYRNIDNRIDFLNKLVSTQENIFQEICRILNI